MKPRLWILGGVIAVLMLFAVLRPPDAARIEPRVDAPVPVVAVPASAGADVAEPLAATGLSARIEFLDRIEMPEGSIETIYPELSARANEGDAVAALQLYLALHHCASAPRTRADLAARMRHYETFKSVIGAERVEWSQHGAQQKFEECKDAPAELLREERGWLNLAAELGLLQAQLARIHDPPTPDIDINSDDPEEIRRLRELRSTYMRWTHEAATAGSVDAMRGLALHYDNNEVLVMPDPVRAYAYALAALTARDAAGLAPSLDRRYAQMLGEELLPYQIAEARELAASYLANPACCKLYPPPK